MNYHRIQAVWNFEYQLLHTGSSLVIGACGVTQEIIGWETGGKKRMPKDRVKYSGRQKARECPPKCLQDLEEAIVPAS
jgi:hypothetical protein